MKFPLLPMRMVMSALMLIAALTPAAGQPRSHPATGSVWLPAPTGFRLLPESRLWMDGSSTIHEWSCKSTRLVGSFAATLAPGKAPVVSRVEVTVPVEQIDCKDGNSTMNRLMRKALQSDKTPTIRYELTGATARPGGTESAFDLLTRGNLTIAGTTHAVEMTVQGRAVAGGRYRFTGSLPVLMSVYGVERPTAMLGTIKTKDEVTVHFDVLVAPE